MAKKSKKNGKKYGNRNITKDDYKKMLDDNPYLTIPQPEEVKHVRDRYKHANKNEPCWQHKWDLIHCVIESPCVKVDGNRARDCLQRHQVLLHSEILENNKITYTRYRLYPIGHTLAISDLICRKLSSIEHCKISLGYSL